jgi:hypothetical protein
MGKCIIDKRKSWVVIYLFISLSEDWCHSKLKKVWRLKEVLMGIRGYKNWYLITLKNVVKTVIPCMSS